jgi:hypothetical protein
MMGLTIDRAIFITNTFAMAHPDLHTQLWGEFLAEVPASKRSGYFGADNIAYVQWLKKKQHPVFLEFIQDHVDVKTF